MSAPAAAAGGKLKLSSIITDLRAQALDMDCKAAILIADANGVCAAFDFEQTSMRSTMDLRLLLLYLGLHALGKQVMQDDSEAWAAVSAAAARDLACRSYE